MSQTIRLDGTNLNLDVDRIEVHLEVPSLHEVSQSKSKPWIREEGGEAMEPIVAYHDGTTVFFHCPPEGEASGCHYVVESARPHHWDMKLDEEQANGSRLRIARFQLVLD